MVAFNVSWSGDSADGAAINLVGDRIRDVLDPRVTLTARYCSCHRRPAIDISRLEEEGVWKPYTMS